MHKKRENGLTKDIMKQLNEKLPTFLILPDSGSNDLKELKELKSKGVDVLVLDHHSMGEESEDAVIINPQICLDTYSNENLAAGGIVYKFLQALDDYYGINDADNYLTLVAVSAISDIMLTTEKETRYYINRGLSQINNPLIKHLAFKNIGHDKDVTMIGVSFKIANFINAIIRVGTQEEKEIIFRAMLGEEEIETRISKYRGVEREVTENLCEKSYRLMTNARGRQNRTKKKLTDEAIQYIEDNNLDKNAFIIVKLDDVPSGFSGLIASSIASAYYKNAVVLSWCNKENAYTGSLRNSPNASIKNVKSFLESVGLFDWIRGHEGAAGVKIKEDSLPKLDKTINSKLQFEKGESEIPVDFIISSKALTSDLIEEVASLEKHFGKGCEQPLFAIEGIKVDCDTITYGNVMKTNIGKIEIMSFSNHRGLQELTDKGNQTASITVVGELGVNEFMGKRTLQVKAESIRIDSHEEKSKFLFQF